MTAVPVLIGADNLIQKFSGTNSQYIPNDYWNRVLQQAIIVLGNRPVIPENADNQARAGIEQKCSAWDQRFSCIFAQNLIGAAETWYFSLPDDRRLNSINLKADFLARYNTVQSEFENKLALEQLRRGPTESVLDYSTRVNKMVALAYPNANAHVIAEKKKETFLRGLTPDKIRRLGYEKSATPDANNAYPSYDDIVTYVRQRDVTRALAKVQADRFTDDTITNKIDKLGEDLNKVLSLTMQNGQVSQNANSVPIFRNQRPQGYNSNNNWQQRYPNNNWNRNSGYRNFNSRPVDNYRTTSQTRPFHNYSRGSDPRRMSNNNFSNFSNHRSNYNPNNPRFKQNGTRFCTYCKRNGHTKGFCTRRQNEVQSPLSTSQTQKFTPPYENKNSESYQVKAVTDNAEWTCPSSDSSHTETNLDTSNIWSSELPYFNSLN